MKQPVWVPAFSSIYIEVIIFILQSISNKTAPEILHGSLRDTVLDVLLDPLRVRHGLALDEEGHHPVVPAPAAYQPITARYYQYPPIRDQY